MFTPQDFNDYGLANPSKMPQAPGGSHGYDPQEDRLHASFIASGAGTKPGTSPGTIENTSVAPTLATLLYLKMEDV